MSLHDASQPECRGPAVCLPGARGTGETLTTSLLTFLSLHSPSTSKHRDVIVSEGDFTL